MKSWTRTTIGLVTLACALTVTGLFPGCRSEYESYGTQDWLTAGRTLSFFTAMQVDPRSEDSAGPQFVIDADVNNDGLTDMISAWNQSQPVQVHIQRRDEEGAISFETVTLAGNIPVVAVAGIEVADFDQDGHVDIAVLIKVSYVEGAVCLSSDVPAEGTLAGMVLLYLGPDDPEQTNQALAWEEIAVETSRLPAPSAIPSTPEISGFTDMALGDIDADGDTDIVLASNESCQGQAADVLVFTNLGPGSVRDGTWRCEVLADAFPRLTIKSIALGDIDLDGDLDIVATFPDAPSMNIRWFRNPVIDDPDDYHISDGLWQVGTIAQIPTGADVIKLADIDRDGRLDVLVRSSGGALIQWLKGGEGPTTSPLRAIPWQVYTVAEFIDRVPEAIALADLNLDGQLEVIAAAQGGLIWFDSQGPPTLYDQWTENLILDDQPMSEGDTDPATTDPNVEPEEVAGSTFINSILVADIDGDGVDDLVVPFDRSGLSGLTNDALVWLRNNNLPR